MARGPIFLSYRRSDTAGHAGRIYDRVSARFRGRVFRDFEAISPGADFVKVIDKRVSAASAMIVVIGPGWVTAEEQGRRRLHDPDDFVRLEVSSALRRGIPTIPVLVGGAELPEEEDLPEDLRLLRRRQALTVREDTFDAGMQKLIGALELALGEATGAPRPSGGGGNAGWIAGLALAGAFALAVFLAFVVAVAQLQPDSVAQADFGSPPPAPTPTPAPIPAPAPPPAPAGFQPAATWSVQYPNGVPFGRLFVNPDQTFRFDVMGIPASLGQWAFDPGTQTLSVNGVNNMGQAFVEQFRVTEPHADPSPHWHVSSMQSGPLEFWPATP